MTIARRTPGTGSIDRLKGGRYRARFTMGEEERVPLGTFETHDEAERTLAAALATINEGRLRSRARRSRRSRPIP